MKYLNQEAPLTNFKMLLNSPIHVDKSGMIDILNKNIATINRYICVTKPRRFGKTLNANMLAAYYTKGLDTHDVFDSLNIAKFDSYETHRNQYHVIYIDFSRMPRNCSSYQAYITWIENGIAADLKEKFPITTQEDDTLSAVFAKTKQSYIYVLDEWDSVFYKDFMSDKDKKAYLEFLKDLLKDQPYVKLAYMTGVLPIAKYSSGSELNIFREFNFMNDPIFDEFFGFTEDEVNKLCEMHKGISYEELKYWYDGYYLSNGRSLFNPRSVNNALLNQVCLNYWTETGPMNEIAEYVEHNVDEVREDIVKLVSGISVEIELQGYSASELQLNTRDEILSAMVVFGFLSYHDGMLHIPNHELMMKFETVLSRNSMGEVKEIVKQSKEMLEATLSCDEEKVASILEEIHDREIPFLKYSDENSLSCVISMSYLKARDYYDVQRESKAGKGYVDYIFIPKKRNYPPIIIELKFGQDVHKAIQQIKDKNYMQKIMKYPEYLLVGITYDEKKRHQCRIEKVKNI